MESQIDTIIAKIGVFSGRPNPEISITGNSIDEFVKLVLGGHSGEFSNHLTIAEALDGGDAAHIEAIGQFGVFVNIHFCQAKTSLVFDSKLFQDGSQGFTGDAPISPEVDDYRCLL